MKALQVVLSGVAAVALAGACARRAGTSDSPPSFQSTAPIPPMLLGSFEDDYGGRHVVSRTEWQQGATSRYRIVKWNVEARYLIAQNAASNPGAPGQWTRIDWVTLDGMPPWTWAFCFSAYEAPSRDSAEATRVARSGTPRTGCNGYPYSRLKAAGPG